MTNKKSGDELIADRTRAELGDSYDDAIQASGAAPSYGEAVTEKRQRRQKSIEKDRKKRMAKKKAVAEEKAKAAKRKRGNNGQLIDEDYEAMYRKG